MPELFHDPLFWVGLGQIILVNIVLSGDNAVVIALAARSLPDRQRRQAIVWGSVAAIVMRIVLTLVAVEMLRLPYLKLVGSLLLSWIAIKLLSPESEGGEGVNGHNSLLAAVRTILLADLVMSLDNVLAVAAAAKGSAPLLLAGLGISVPVVIFGSTVVMRLMDRYPVIIVLGAAILGYVAGEMVVTEPALANWSPLQNVWVHSLLPFANACLIVVVGKWMSGQRSPLVTHVAHGKSAVQRDRLG